jgi:hypothetical protein
MLVKILKTILFIGWLIVITSCQETKTYCGKVSEKYLLHKNNGGTHNIIFYCDSLHKFINVSVTADCYVNTKKDDIVCFSLNDYQIGK